MSTRILTYFADVAAECGRTSRGRDVDVYLEVRGLSAHRAAIFSQVSDVRSEVVFIAERNHRIFGRPKSG